MLTLIPSKYRTSGVERSLWDQADSAIRNSELKTEIGISEVAAVVSIPIHEGEQSTKSRDTVVSLERVRRLLRRLGTITADHGVILPIIGVAFRASGSSPYWRDILSAARDESWHEGYFQLIPADSVADAKDLIRDLLEPESIEGYRGVVSAPTVGEIEKLVKSSVPGPGVDVLLDHLFRSPPGLSRESAVRQWIEWAESGMEPQRVVDKEQSGNTPSVSLLATIGGFCADRVARVVISGWRGFVRRKELDTDADLVLVVGPNGTGKSSLLEAIACGLTGRPTEERRRHDGMKSLASEEETATIDLHILDKGNRETESTREADLVTEIEGTGVITRSWRDGRLPTNALQRIIATPSIPPTLQYRLTCFFQDDHEEIYEERSHGKTLLDLFFPLPDEASEPYEAMKQALDELSKIGSKPKPEARLDEARPEVGADIWRRFVDSNERLLRILGEAEAQLGLPREDWSKIDSWLGFAEKFGLEPSLSNTLVALEDWLKARLRQLSSQNTDSMTAGADSHSLGMLQSRRAEIIGQMEIAESGSKNSDSIDRWIVYRGSRFHGQSELGLVLRILFERLEHWSSYGDANTEDLLSPIVAEFKLIDRARLRSCLHQADRLETIVERTRFDVDGMKREKIDIDNKINELLESDPGASLCRRLIRELGEIDKRVISEWWAKYKAWSNSNESIGQLERAFEDYKARVRDLKSVVGAVDRSFEGPGTESLRRTLEKATSLVLRRMALTGEARLEVVADEQVLTDNDDDDNSVVRSRRMLVSRFEDGRDVRHFSTGQRAQVALATMIAQKLIAVEQDAFKFPNRVLVIDDPSTSYDLTNIGRQMTLMRQLAYHPEPAKRFQIFLSSHHDTVSSQLIDSLVPPQGCRLKILHFKAWTMEAGPEIEEFDVQESPELSQRLKEDMESCL